MNLRSLTITALTILQVHFALAEENKPLNFDEVYSLVKTNLTDLPEAELKSLAAIGLVKELGTKVQLVSTNDTNTVTHSDPVSRKSIFNESYAYLRITDFQENLPAEFEKDFKELGLNKKLKGLVIDLRYAQGQDYEAAAKLADKFLKGEEVLLKFGDKEIRSSAKTEVIKLPVAMLVNGQTAGAAEAFAAIMSEKGVGLIIGQATAGTAKLFQTFTLSNGQKLKIGNIPVELSSGKAIASTGLNPDIKVNVQPQLEKVFYKDPYKSMNMAFSETNDVATATNRLARRFNEAELVRRHREGAATETDDENTPAAEPATPVIMDPALGRALDFLKGVSVLQERKS